MGSPSSCTVRYVVGYLTRRSFLTPPLRRWLPGLRHRDRDVDIARHGLGVRAPAPRGVHHRLRDVALQTRQADAQARLEEVLPAALAQIHFGVDGRLRREPDPHRASRLADGADEARRPAG